MNRKQAYFKIRRAIRFHKNVFIMGHKDMDLDAIGGCLGIYDFVHSKGKNAFLIVNDKKHEAGVQKILKMVEGVNIVSSKEIPEDAYRNSLLIIVDTNKKALLQDANIFEHVSKTIILDHHDTGEDTVPSNIPLILKDSSSASELIVEFLYYFGYKISADIANFLLAGITLDTNGFSQKTGSKTHLVACYLLECGASVKFVNTLLKQDLEDYILRQKVITDVKIMKKTIAFAKGSTRVIYKREELAKIADTLLEFNHIETSYVIGKLSDTTVGISARSVGDVNVGQVLSLLGGGGDVNDAACRIENKSLKEVEALLKKVLGEVK